MTIEQAKSELMQIYGALSPDKQRAIDTLVKIEPCDDAISRKDIQDYIAKYLSQYLYEDVREAVEVIDEYIGELPSVTPKPKTDVLDKIRAELHATAEMHEDGDYYLRDEWIDEYFDKYKAESEDK